MFIRSVVRKNFKNFSRFCWNAFLLGPITLRVETRIFICKRMPAYSAKRGGNFFLAIEILICLKVSVYVEIVAILCVNTSSQWKWKYWQITDECAKDKENAHNHPSLDRRQPFSLFRKRKIISNMTFIKWTRGKSILTIPQLLEDLDKNRLYLIFWPKG